MNVFWREEKFILEAGQFIKIHIHNFCCDKSITTTKIHPNSIKINP